METKSATHGLKGKVRQLHAEMQEARKTGRDVTLKSHLSARYGGLTPGHLYAELGIDPSFHTVEYLLATDDDTKWLVPEVVRDAIRKGLMEDAYWQDLVAADEPISGKSVVVPWIDLQKIDIQHVAEGGTIPKSAITYADKTVTTRKRAVGVDITYEAIRYCSINLLAAHLAQVGINLGALLTRDALDVLVNGEQEDGSEAAAVIGVNSTSDGLTYADYLTAFVRMAMMNATPDKIVTTETLTGTTLQMEEFKERKAGTTDKRAVLRQPLPEQVDLFPSFRVATGTAILAAKNRAMNRVVSVPLMVESDKIINRQIVESVASTTYGFYIVNRAGRAIIDVSKAYSGYPFPAWFRPIEE